MKTIPICILLISALLIGCETDIPITDTTAPEFTFQITGDGFNRVFDQDTDYSNFQLHLRDGARYDFTYTGTDLGGVELIQWQIDIKEYIVLETPIASTWTSRDVSQLSRMIEWSGDRNNPLTGNVITGRFRTNAQIGALTFRFYVQDFGGEGRVPNSSSGTLNIYLADHTTEINPF